VSKDLRDGCQDAIIASCCSVEDLKCAIVFERSHGRSVGQLMSFKQISCVLFAFKTLKL
jgi:hypothetical protein